MRLKRRKWLISTACAAIAFALFLFLTREREPEYEGRKLSEWLAQVDGTIASREKVQPAVQQMGTNALPCLLKWTDYEPPAWRLSLYQKLPTSIASRRIVVRWLVDESTWRKNYSSLGFMFLGTNAASAIPQLETMMKSRTNRKSASQAIFALGHIGEPAIPVLKAGLADPNQTNRDQIVRGFLVMAYEHGTNACLPILIEALNDPDPGVRWTATNVVQCVAPGAYPDLFPQ